MATLDPLTKEYLAGITDDKLRIACGLFLLASSYRGENKIEDILDWIWHSELEKLLGEKETIHCPEKCNHEANRLRQEGNRHFKERNYEMALKLYNLSILVAPHPVLSKEEDKEYWSHPEEEPFAFPRIDPARYGGIAQGESTVLAKGFANRSAVMMELNLYDKCLFDINLALEYGYPKELGAKLENRKQRCLMKLKASERKEESVAESEGKEERVAETGNMVDIFKKLSVSNMLVPEKTLKERLLTKIHTPIKLKEPNPNIPSFSSAVKLSYLANRGRGIVAVRDVRPGELLCVERAVAISMSTTRLREHCSTCTRLCLTPLPCPGCSQVIFCSKSCRTRGLAEDHWLECKILPMLIARDIEGMVCSYKLLKTFSSHQQQDIIKELRKKYTDHPRGVGYNQKDMYSSTSYESVFQLCEHAEKVPRNDKVNRCLKIYRIAVCLKQSGRYFVSSNGNPLQPSKDEFLDTCKLLLLNFEKECTNAFDLFQKKSIKVREACINPAISLLNHSCYPSAVVLPGGRESVVVAVRPIGVGEEVLISYYSFVNQGKLERLNLLKPYNFICRCVACEYNWPSDMDRLPLFEMKNNLWETDLEMGEKMKIDWASSELIRIVDDSLLGVHKPTEKELQTICKVTEIVHKYLMMPCIYLITLKDLLCNHVVEVLGLDG